MSSGRKIPNDTANTHIFVVCLHNGMQILDAEVATEMQVIDIVKM